MNFAQRLAQIADAGRDISVSSLCFLADLNAEEREQLREYWPSIDLEQRRRVIKDLVQLGEDNVEFDFSAVFFNALEDEDEEVRAAAVDGLWENEERAFLHRLFDMMRKDESSLVRAAAATGMARFAYKAEVGELDQRWVDNIKRALTETFHKPGESCDVRRRALEAVAYFSDHEEVSRMIERAYATDDLKMKASAIFAMGHTLNQAWLSVILREMESPVAEMRFEAARASGEIGDRRAVLPVISLLEDADTEVRLAAISALGQMGGKQAETALRRCCQSADPATRDAAQDALEELRFNSDPLDVLSKHLS